MDKDRDVVFAAAGAITSGRADEEGASASSTCMICMEEIAEGDRLSMNCGHMFCKTCWLGHFKVNISEGKSSQMTCMAYKCGAICDQSYAPTRVFDVFVPFRRMSTWRKQRACRLQCGANVACGDERDRVAREV